MIWICFIRLLLALKVDFFSSCNSYSIDVLDRFAEMLGGKFVRPIEHTNFLKILFGLGINLEQSFHFDSLGSFHQVSFLFSSQAPPIQSLEVALVDWQCLVTICDGFGILLKLIDVDAGESSIDKTDNIEFSDLRRRRKVILALLDLDGIDHMLELNDCVCEFFWIWGGDTLLEKLISFIFERSQFLECVLHCKYTINDTPTKLTQTDGEF